MSLPSMTHAERMADDAVKAFYFVNAEPDPGLLARLIEPLAKLGLVPDRVHASTENGNGRALEADLRVSGLTARQAHLIEKNLRAIIGVRSVITLVE